MLSQPKDVLCPPAFSVEAAEKWALSRSAALPEHLFRITSHWSINYFMQPVLAERKAHYMMRLVQSQNYGMSTAPRGMAQGPNPEIVGLDARDVLKKRLCRNYVDRTALVDLVMGYVSRAADQEIFLHAESCAKYEARAQLFAREADAVLKRSGLKKKKKPCVLVIGSTAGIIGALHRQGFRVLATDLSRSVLGLDLGGIRVESGRAANTRGMKEADLAILTGLTLPNRSLRGLISLAKEHNTSTMIWAITGRNFGEYYTEHGVDSVISDPAPFTLLPGPSTMAVWRRKAAGSK